VISISRLLCDSTGPGDWLRYVSREGSSASQRASAPIVVWNCTRQCNLRCLHCYASADSRRSPEEMSTAEGKAFMADLADFGVPVLLFSGGEPLLRDDIFELAAFAREQGVRPVLSSNGTLITKEVAEQLRYIGFGEVGISLDGIGERHDHFRGQKGAYEAALRGIRNCVAAGQRVSLRLTITRWNYKEIPAIFELAEQEAVDRICFYHLAYVGRASSLGQQLSHSETRSVIDQICQHTLDLYGRGLKKEVLTVDNHADGIYLYLKLRSRDVRRAEEVLSLLQSNGGNNSGIRIGAVDELGDVHPDQFWRHYSLGNVRQRKFRDIWTDDSEPLLRGLKNRRGLLKGRCARCRYVGLCNGNLRVRAEAVFGDVWAEDPACYLTDEEIGIGQ